MITSLMRPHTTSSPSQQVGEIAGAQPAVAEEGCGGRRVAVVARASPRCRGSRARPPPGRARPRPLAGPRRGSRARAPPCPAARSGASPAAAWVHRRGVALGLEHPAVDRVGAQPGHRRGERAGDGHLGHAEGREDRPGTHAVGRRGVDERLHRRGVHRLGPVEGDAQAREVEALGATQRPGGQHPREVRARRWRCRRRSESHSIQRAGRARKSCGAPSTRSVPGRQRQRPEADEPHVVVEREPRHHHVVAGLSAAASMMASRLAQHGAVGQHHALGLAGRAAGELQHGEADRDRPRGAR